MAVMHSLQPEAHLDGTGSSSPVTRVMVASADDAVLERLAIRLAAEPGVVVVRVHTTPGEVERRMASVRPDVLVVDVAAGGGDMADAIAVSDWTHGPAPVLVLGDRPEPSREALRAGARGYFVRDAENAEVAQLVRLMACAHASRRDATITSAVRES